MYRVPREGDESARRSARGLDVIRTVLLTTLFVAAFATELVFWPNEPLTPVYLLCGAGYLVIFSYSLLGRAIGGRRVFAVLQVAGDTILVLGFVLATGGATSPLSFLFALPIMAAAALLGLQGGVMTAIAGWLLFASLLVHDVWLAPTSELAPGRVLYAAVSHLVGFLSLGIFGGVLADRVQLAHREIAEQRGDLADLRAMQRHIVESISTGLMTTDLEGRVTYLNRVGLELLGRRDAQGQRATDIFSLPADLFEQADDHLSHGRRYRFERPWTRESDGETLLLGFSVSALADRSSRPIGWLVVFQDLTEIASLEEQVRTRERMAALGEMAAGMAHELRNPLAAITGCIQVLRAAQLNGNVAAETGEPVPAAAQSPGPAGGGTADGTEPPGADDDRDALQSVVLSEARRLDRIIRDFLQFARPAPLRRCECDLAPLMEELARMLDRSPDVGPEHRIRVVAGPGATVAHADPDAMRQVFWNLATNALKAMPDGGMLLIRVSGHAGDRVLVEFRDEGHGMDLDTARRYFQPFQSSFQSGTGLGAAIVYRIVEEHGGQIQLVSGRGRGTSIRVIVPAAAAAGHAAGPATSAANVSEAG